MLLTGWLNTAARGLRVGKALVRKTQRLKPRRVRLMCDLAPMQLECRALLSLLAAVDYPVGIQPVALATADVNEDTRPDVITANVQSNNVSVLLGNGNGTFGAATNFPTGTIPVSVTTALLDADAHVDIIVANLYDDTVSVLLGNGNGTFKPAVNFAVGDMPSSVNAVDLDNDTEIDLAVTNYNSGTFSVLIGNGNGTFKPKSDFPVGIGPSSVKTGLIDADANVDLVVTNVYSNNVSVLIGNGNGTFKPAVNFATGQNPTSVAIDDLDDDGNEDLIIANNSSSTVSTLLGNGNGTFKPAVNYAVGTNPVPVTSIDANGDTNVDIVSGNFGAGSISVLLNSAAAIINDDSSRPPTTTFGTTGTWTSNTVAGRGFNQELLFAAAGTGTSTATWTFNGLTPGGTYQISATWFPLDNRATNAPYTISSAGAGASATTTVPVNQQLAPASFTEDNGGTNTSTKWQDLTTSFIVGASGTLTVQLTNNANGYVIADAIRVKAVTPVLVASAEIQVNSAVTANNSTVDFGTEPSGTATPVTKTIKITNNGTSNLTLGTMTAIPAGYTVNGYAPPYSLTPGSSTTFTITLDPTVTPGTYTGSISIPTNDPGANPITLNLTGIVASQIIDNSSPAGYAETPGSSWSNNTVAGAGYLANLRFAPQGSNSFATWTFTGLDPAQTFTVFATWRPYSNRATNAPYTITGLTTTTVTVDQTLAPNDVTDNGGNFEQLAINVLPDATGKITITLSTTGIAPGTFVIADAVRIVDPPSTLNAATPNPNDFGPSSVADLSRVYRVYNPVAAFHHFTTGESEASILVTQFGYGDETAAPAFGVLPTHVNGSVPLHRMYNQNNGQHYLTPSDSERDALLALDPTGHGWKYEGVLGEIFTAPHQGTTEVFMLYNDINGEHLYTPYANEVTAILAIPGGHWHQQSSLGFAYAIDGLPNGLGASQQSSAPTASAMSLEQGSGTATAAPVSSPVIAVAADTQDAPVVMGQTPTADSGTSPVTSSTAESSDPTDTDAVFTSLGHLLDGDL